MSPKTCYIQLTIFLEYEISCITLFKAQSEDGNIRGTETCWCYICFNYLLIAFTRYKIVLDCKLYIYIYIYTHTHTHTHTHSDTSANE